MKQKKEDKKKPLKTMKEKRAKKKEKNMDVKEDMAMMNKKIKKGCMK